MSRHTIAGAAYQAGGSARVAPGTPVADMKGEHSAVWIFAVATGCIGPEDLALADQTHVDVGGTRLALAAHWSEGFLQPGGKGRVRLYFDANVTTPAQQAALEHAFLGQDGGPLGVFGSLEVLKSRAAAIQVSTDCSAEAIHPDVVHVVVKPLEETGDGAGAGSGGLAEGSGQLVLQRQRKPDGMPVPVPGRDHPLQAHCTVADGTGSEWRDSELWPDQGGYWKSSGNAEICLFDWGWPEQGRKSAQPAVAAPPAPAPY